MTCDTLPGLLSFCFWARRFRFFSGYLQVHGYPVAIVTLKNRMLSPLTELFIEHVREVAKSIVASQ